MATLAVRDVELQCVNLFGPIMDLVGLYGAAVNCNGSHPFLDPAIRDGLTRMGYQLADPSGLAVADSDVAALDPRALRRLLEWAELHILEVVQKYWFRAEFVRKPGATEIRMVGSSAYDPLTRVAARIAQRVGELKAIVKTPYQSMNVPISLGTIVRGSRLDPSLPPSVTQLPPWALAPDGLWFYGCGAPDYWGAGDWCDGWGGAASAYPGGCLPLSGGCP